ncbi:MAG: PAS domain S-box protein [Candidatus Delongbacteria bacterium]|nr:PAS domain S-box protein [Candidatus Delongbacteria bacterium]
MKSTKYLKYDFSERYYFLLISVLLTLLFLSSNVYSKEIVKIGTYENPPKIFTDETGKVSGFWAEITNYIAEEEDWKIEWVHGTWDECLTRLEANEIDIMVDTGLTPEREKKYLFSNEVVQLSWTRIYKTIGSDIENVLDLEGKKIGGLKNSFDIEGPGGLRKILNNFEIGSEIIQMGSYAAVFRALEEKTIDAGIVDKDFGNLNDKNFNILITPIIFQPAKMLYAFNKNSVKSEAFKNKIDAIVRELKNDKNSVYYTALSYFFGSAQEKFKLPDWVMLSFVSSLGIVLISIVSLLFANFYSKRLVNIRTMELSLEFERRVKAEKTIRKSEALYKDIVELGNIAIVVDDIDGKFLYFNKRFSDLFGYSEDEMKKQSHNSLIHADDIEMVSDIHRNRIQGEKVPSNYEFKGLKKDKTVVYIHISVSNVIKKDGRIIGSRSYLLNITERKKMEEALRESEENYRTMIEQSNDMIWTLDKEGNFTFFNTRSEEITGYFFKDWEGKSFAPLIVEEDLPKVTEVFMSTLKGQPGNYEVRIFGKKGQIIILSVNTAAMLKGGEIIGTVSFGRDITARKKAEGELRHSEENFRNIFQSVPESLLAVDKQIEVLKSNNAFAKLISNYAPELNMSEDELKQKILTELRKQSRKSNRGIIEISAVT